jgi:hypothetical protein
MGWERKELLGNGKTKDLKKPGLPAKFVNHSKPSSFKEETYHVDLPL